MAKLAAGVYGNTLFELAVETDQVDELWAEVKVVLQVLRENREIFKLMDHPEIVKEEKIRILEDIFQGHVSEELLGLMELLLSKNRYGEIESVFSCFTEQAKENKSIGTAYVTSPQPLEKEQKEQILEKLLETTKYVSFEMHYAVDSRLIGGLVIRIGDKVVDSSIQTKLQRLTGDLLKIQLKAGEGVL